MGGDGERLMCKRRKRTRAVRAGTAGVFIILLTLFAAFAAACRLFPSEYTITFAPNGGSGTMESIVLTSGSVITLPSNTFTHSQDNYFFSGWSLSEYGSALYPDEGSFTMGRSDITLYAKWLYPGWTIMVWLDGDNSLQKQAREDFHEMEKGLAAAKIHDPHLTDKLKIIVQYDETTAGSQGRFEVQPIDSPDYSSAPSAGEIGSSFPEPNMGDAEELRDFIEFCKTEYPAEHHALILWNHGSGVRSITPSSSQSSSGSRAICIDDTDGGDMLYIGEIKDVLNTDHQVDLIGMDACLMGMVEIAYEFRPGIGDFQADAAVFSPANEQGDGWEYERILKRLSGNDQVDKEEDPCYDAEDLTALQLAGIIVKEYQDAFSGINYETQTAVDLTKIASVKTAVDALSALLPDHRETIENIRDNSSAGAVLLNYFNEASLSEWKEYASFDLYALAKEISTNPSFSSDSEDSEDSEVRQKAETLMSAVDAAVTASWAGSSYSGFEPGRNGLGIFFPDGAADHETETYWDYQYFYTSLPHNELQEWGTGKFTGPIFYGDIDFCAVPQEKRADGIVDGWFELLQFWYNPEKDLYVHPGPMW